jgi:hypothetical protein
MMNTNSHLSDNEFAEVLGSNASQTMLAHLKICDECSVEAKELREVIGGLREGLIAAAGQPRIQHVPPELSARQSSHAWRLRMAGALAVLLMFSGGIVLDRHSQSSIGTNGASNQQLSDSELLNQVQAELSLDAPAALQPAAYLAQERQQILQSAQQRGEQRR